MKNRMKHFFSALHINGKELLLFSFLYRLLGLFLFSGLITWLVNLCLKFRPYRYITVENLPDFLLSPAVILCLTVLMILLFLFVYFEAGIILCGTQASFCGRHISWTQMVAAGARRSARMLSLRHLQAALPFFAFFVISNLFFLYEFFYRVNPFCTYLPIMFQYTPGRIAAAVLISLSAFYAFLRLFTFHFLMLEGTSPSDGEGKTAHPIPQADNRRQKKERRGPRLRPAGRTAADAGHDRVRPELSLFRRKSRRIFFAHPFRILVSVLIICLVTIGLWYLLRFFLSLLAALLVALIAPADIQVALTLTLNQYIILITLGLAATFGYIIHSAYITFFFYRHSGCSPEKHTILYSTLLPARPFRLFPVLVLTVTLAVSVFTFIGIYRGTIRAERAISPVLIVAHRGFSSKAPENTVPAISLAADYMADYAEIDVQCTTDGEVVLFHDRSLSRIASDRRRLQELSFVELSEVDIGSFFSFEYAGLRVNTLREALEAADGRIRLIIELKRNSVSGDLVPKVLSLLEEYDMEDQCIIQSTDYDYLREVKELNPEMTTGIILTSALGNYYSRSEYVDFFCVRSAFVTQNSVRRIQAQGRQIFAWTINTRAEMERMKRLQVDGIITDYPILAREVLYREEESEFLLFVSEQLQKAAEERDREQHRKDHHIQPTTEAWDFEYGTEEPSSLAEESGAEPESLPLIPPLPGPWQPEESG